MKPFILLICLFLCVVARDHNDNRDYSHGYYDKDHRVKHFAVNDKYSNKRREAHFYRLRHRHYHIIMGQKIPVEIWRVSEPVPPEMLVLLPPAPPNVEFYMAGDQVYQLDKRSRRIIRRMPVPVVPPPQPIFFPTPPLFTPPSVDINIHN